MNKAQRNRIAARAESLVREPGQVEVERPTLGSQFVCIVVGRSCSQALCWTLCVDGDRVRASLVIRQPSRPELLADRVISGARKRRSAADNSAV